VSATAEVVESDLSREGVNHDGSGGGLIAASVIAIVIVVVVVVVQASNVEADGRTTGVMRVVPSDRAQRAPRPRAAKDQSA